MGHMEVGAPRLYGEANSLTNRVAWPFHFSYYVRFTPEADICTATGDVDYGPLADIPTLSGQHSNRSGLLDEVQDLKLRMVRLMRP